ncbi:hypothetical protein [Deinococcus radiotolerans]|uniref:Uncharacterized protein n=1 Tax=Deinococcus radiotolerans TaxID=1309407 RepID=A0ABQ2FQC9_9DEIO|nr:hypothetical protein [Deinococcus radiotolerans]GGL16579.1 hypothetical protein GCM10010844_39340 [Deinococcus radiotolerans]
MTYNPKRRGPDLAHAWTVLEGAVVIIGADDTVTFTAGSTWPGISALPRALTDQLAPHDTERLAGTRVVPWTASPREAEFAAVLLQVQLMRSDRQGVPDRLGLLQHVAPLTADNRQTIAAALGMSRSTLDQVRHLLGAPTVH